jgi:hypothetical protein
MASIRSALVNWAASARAWLEGLLWDLASEAHDPLLASGLPIHTRAALTLAAWLAARLWSRIRPEIA